MLVYYVRLALYCDSCLASTYFAIYVIIGSTFSVSYPKKVACVSYKKFRRKLCLSRNLPAHTHARAHTHLLTANMEEPPVKRSRQHKPSPQFKFSGESFEVNTKRMESKMLDFDKNEWECKGIVQSDSLIVCLLLCQSRSATLIRA